MALSEFQRERVRAWLRERRGGMSQAALAEDITKKSPGWSITRDRYSKYESGGAGGNIGPAVLQRFIDYWAGEGQPGPDLEPPAPPSEPVDPQLVLAEAISRQAAALERQNELASMASPGGDTQPGLATLAAAIDRQTAAIEAQTQMLERVLSVRQLVDPAQVAALEAWAQAMLSSLSPDPTADPPAIPAR